MHLTFSGPPHVNKVRAQQTRRLQPFAPARASHAGRWGKSLLARPSTRGPAHTSAPLRRPRPGRAPQARRLQPQQHAPAQDRRRQRAAGQTFDRDLPPGARVAQGPRQDRALQHCERRRQPAARRGGRRGAEPGALPAAGGDPALKGHQPRHAGRGRGGGGPVPAPTARSSSTRQLARAARPARWARRASTERRSARAPAGPGLRRD